MPASPYSLPCGKTTRAGLQNPPPPFRPPIRVFLVRAYFANSPCMPFLENRNIFFIGPRACGKTSLGGIVAERLGAVFVDMDALLVDRAGRSIALFVEKYGWDAFRGLEHEVLIEICAKSGQVVATGGGVVLLPENRDLLQKSGSVFYLKAGVPALLSRLMADPLEDQRPALTDKSLEAEISEVLRERGPLYQGCADVVIDAQAGLEDMADAVIKALA